MHQKCKGSHKKAKAVYNKQIAFYLQFILGHVNITLIGFRRTITSTNKANNLFI